MITAEDFRNQFDVDGRFHRGNGELPIVFATRGGGRFPGTLLFKEGLCWRAEMERGGEWALPDESPLHVSFLVAFGTERLYRLWIAFGRVMLLDETPAQAGSKSSFLTNLRVARNLFIHGKAMADTPEVDTSAIERTLARAAIWLTPKSVSGFNAADFPELGVDRQQELLSAVQSFLSIAGEIAPEKPAMPEEYGNAAVAFSKILTILDPYLPMLDEARNVEGALRTVKLPPWVANWNYDLGSDADGVPAVWVDVFADDETVPRTKLGRAASELTTSIRQAFRAAQVDRWPYVRLKTVVEHKAG